MRTQAPYPDPDLAGGVRRTERFYYDGIRRIQEVFVDPVAAASMVDGDPELTLLAAASIGSELFEIDGLSAPAAFEAAQTGDDQEDPEPDPGNPGPGNPGGPSPTVHTWLDREYVWGPGDRGVDELLIQFNAGRAAMPILQDAGGDCIALCDFGGTAGAARVVAQFTYDPYGQVITHEHLVAQHAFLRAGHKGLFVDRLDVGVLTSGDETPRLAAGANLLAHNRNRTLKPELGRYMQMDPNASALVVIAASTHSGGAVNAAVSGFDLEILYGDGANLYQYLGSSTWMNSDPLGLFLGADDLVMWGVGAIRGGLEAVIEQYGANLEWDIDWALDWSMGDDWNSRLDNGWVNVTFALGSHRGMMDQIRNSFFVDELESGFEYLFASAGSGTKNAGKGGRRGVRIAGSYAGFSETIRIDGKIVATKFKHPKHTRRMVKFERELIVATVNVPPTNSKKEIREATRRAIEQGKVPANIDWDKYVWHHHWVVGEMQLIPKKIHEAVGHKGRAATWPLER